MIEEVEEQEQTSTGGGIPVRDIGYQSEWEKTPPETDYLTPRDTPSPTPFNPDIPKVIDDETARNYLDEYRRMVPGVDPEREFQINLELDRYFAGDAERKKDETENFFLKNYTDESSLNELAKDPNIKLRESQSLTPELERKKMLNWSWLQEQTGQPLATEAEYELARDKWASEHDNLARMTDQQFFDTRKKQYENLAERRVMVSDLMGEALKQGAKDGLNGEPTDMNAIFEKIKNRYPEHFKDPKTAEDTMAMLAVVGADVKTAADNLRPVVAQTYPILEKIANKTATTEDIKQLTDFYRTNPEQFENALQAATLILHSEGDQKPDQGVLKGTWTEMQNIGKAFKEGIIGPLVNASRVQQETWVRDQMENIANDPASYQNPATQKLISDYQAVLDVLDMERALDSFKKREVDPINYLFDKDTWGGRIERGTLSGIQSAPLMAATWLAQIGGTYVGGPTLGILAGQAVMGLATRDQEYEDMRRQGVPHDKAMFWSNASAVAQAPFNFVEFKITTGRFTALNKTIQAVRDGQLSRLVSIGARGLAGQMLEFSAEESQNMIQSFAGEVAQQAQIDLPKAQHKAWNDALDQGWETFFATLPFTMFGTGVAHFNETSALHMLTTENLLLNGLTQEAVDRIHAFHNVESMQHQLGIELNNMSPEDRARGAEQIREEQRRAEAAADGMRNDPVMPHVEQEKKPDGTTQYNVVNAKGETISSTNSSTAAGIAVAAEANRAKTEEQQAQAEVAASDEGIMAEAEAKATEEILGEAVPAETAPEAAPAAAPQAAPEAEAATPEAAPPVTPGQVEVTKYDAKAKEFIKVKEKPTKGLASELNDQAQVLHNVVNCVTRS